MSVGSKVVKMADLLFVANSFIISNYFKLKKKNLKNEKKKVLK